jgi:YHS domain-containing protein
MKTRLHPLLGFLLVLTAFTLHSADPASCPISGEPADPEVKVTVNGKDVAFCCNGCRGAYEKKLNVTDEGAGKCPISGRDAIKETRQLHATSTVTYFCCDNCFKPFINRNKLKVSDNAPDKCPISGQPAQAASFVVHNGEKVYFCCDKCPNAFLKRINAKDNGPEKCPVSGRAAVATSKMILTETKAVYFCCDNCPKAYADKHFTARN